MSGSRSFGLGPSSGRRDGRDGFCHPCAGSSVGVNGTASAAELRLAMSDTSLCWRVLSVYAGRKGSKANRAAGPRGGGYIRDRPRHQVMHPVTASNGGNPGGGTERAILTNPERSAKASAPSFSLRFPARRAIIPRSFLLSTEDSLRWLSGRRRWKRLAHRETNSYGRSRRLRAVWFPHLPGSGPFMRHRSASAPRSRFLFGGAMRPGRRPPRHR